MKTRASDVVRQRTQNFDKIAREADFLFRFPQCRIDAVGVIAFLAAAGKTDLPRVRAQVGIALGEQHRQAVAAFDDPGVAAVASRVLDAEGRLVDFIDAGMTWYGKAYKPFVGEVAGTLGLRPKDVLFGTGSAMFVRRDVFQELGGSGITVVLVTHEPDIAEYASRVIVVRDGLVRSDKKQTPTPAIVPDAPPSSQTAGHSTEAGEEAEARAIGRIKKEKPADTKPEEEAK